MTITSKVNKVQIASGTSINVANLEVTASSQLLVTRLAATTLVETVLVENSGYTVSSDLSTITLTDAIDTTTYIRATVTVKIPETQSSDYVNINPHNTEVTEADLDKVTLKLKEIQEKLDRVLVAPISTPTGTFELPNLDSQAGKFMKLNATEDGFEFADITSITFWEDFSFPSGDGTAEQILETDGSGTLSWTDASDGVFEGVTGEALLVYNQVTATILRSDNVTSVTDVSAGKFTINFTTAISDANYSIAVGVRGPTDDGNGMFLSANSSDTKTTSALGLQCRTDIAGVVSSVDSPENSVLIYT